MTTELWMLVTALLSLIISLWISGKILKGFFYIIRAVWRFLG